MPASWHPTDAALAEGLSGTLPCNPAQMPFVSYIEVSLHTKMPPPPPAISVPVFITTVEQDVKLIQ